MYSNWFNNPNYNAMQSCHFHDLDMQAVHLYTQACILIELQTCTQIQFEGHQRRSFDKEIFRPLKDWNENLIYC